MASLRPPEAALASLASTLLARAVVACQASSAPPEEHTVVLELQQSPETPGLLGLRVCDDGLPLPTEQRQLERCGASLAAAAGALARPLVAGGALLVQTTGPEEVVVRRYTLKPTGPGQGDQSQLSIADAGAAPKPPGSTLRGSVFEATLLLQQPAAPVGGNAARGSSDARMYVQQLLSDVDGGAAPTQAAAHQQLLACADQAVTCLQQLLGMLRVLAPPAPDGSLQRVSGSRRFDLQLESQLGALARFGRGMAAEFMPQQALPAPAGPTEAGGASGQSGPAAAVPPSPASSSEGREAGEGATATAAEVAAATAALPLEDALPSASAGPAAGGSGQAPAAGAGGAGTEAATAAAAGQPPGPAPPLTYIGVGEAGWGCAGAAQTFRACKWAARAGIVLRMPDHAQLAAAAAAAREPAPPAVLVASAASAAGDDGTVLGVQGAAEVAGSSRGASAAGQQPVQQGAPAQRQPRPPEQQPQPAQGPTPVFLFRRWGMQFEGQQAALKGVERCEWPEYGFQLERAEGGADGPIAAVLRCAQPASGASLAAAVVHLTPSDYRAAAEGKQPPGLAPSRESQLVRAALEGALAHLKQQCPAVISSRRERSLERALPLISNALAGILLRSKQSDAYSGGGAADEEGSVLHAACSSLGCPPEGLQEGIGSLLWEVVNEHMRGSSAGSDGQGAAASKRARQDGSQGGGDGSQPASE
ncbi:hypothetical protein ABPG75_009305 [Micractinium tetrahymenae]